MSKPIDLQNEVIAKAVKDADFRAELEKDPKGVFQRETGLELSEKIQVKVLKEEPSTLYLMVPEALPPQDGALSDGELAQAVGGAKLAGGAKLSGGLSFGFKNISAGSANAGACHDYLCCDGTLDVTG